jgi:hypothetical protein
MKIQEIVAQLASRLPLYSTEFTDPLSVVSIIHTGTTATIITSAPQTLKVGDSIHVEGAKTPVTISAISHVAGSGIAIATTATDHDLTLFTDTALRLATVSGITGGANQLAFNVTDAVLLDVPDRRTFHYAVATTADTSWTGGGAAIIENGSNVYNTVRGQYAVATVSNSTTFTVEHTSGTSLGTLIGTITMRVKPRVTGAMDDEAAFDSYTRDVVEASTQERPAKVWAYVVIGDVDASRGRGVANDSIDVQSLNGDWKQTLLNPFKVLVAQFAGNDALGRAPRDAAEDFLRPMLRSLLGKNFGSGLAIVAPHPVQFVRHAFARYDGGVYWHEFEFQQRTVVSFADTVGAEDDVAFRDWDLTGDPDVDDLLGEGEIVQITSLDDTPI